MNDTAKKRVLVVEDDASLNTLLVDQIEKMGHDAQGARSRAQALDIMQTVAPDLMIMDMRLPDCDGFQMLEEYVQNCPIIVLTAYGSVNQAVRAVHAGASDYLTKPVSSDNLGLAVKRAFATVELKRDVFYWQSQALRVVNDTIVGSSRQTEEMRALIRLYASADSTVLVAGESGVGKELVARAIHRASARSEGRFVPIDCDPSQETLIASELFGHEKGAFSGADARREGMLEIADRGTIYLNDIAEVSSSLQSKLLRVMETGEFRRLGGAQNLMANVRIVAGTSRDLPELVRKNRFRSELFYRLGALSIHVPPLRERLEDVPMLAQHFLDSRRFYRARAKEFAPETLAALKTYSWPGNVRELRNTIERGLIMSGDETVIRPRHVLVDDAEAGPTDHRGGRVRLNFDDEPTLEQVRDEYLRLLLERYEGNRNKVATILGISERNTYRLVGKLPKDGDLAG